MEQTTLTSHQVSHLKKVRDNYPTIQPPQIGKRKKSALLRYPMVYNQQGLDSCSACALSMALMIHNPQIPQPSVLYLYYKERLLARESGNGRIPSEADALTVITQYGVCSEKCWPYDPMKSNLPPPHECNLQASQNKAGRAGLVDLESIHDMILSGIPVMVGLQIYSNFSPDINGDIGLPQGKYRGGHEVLIIGYQPGKFICLNSWGKEWGKDGCFIISEAYLSNPEWVYSLTCVLDFPSSG